MMEHKECIHCHCEIRSDAEHCPFCGGDQRKIYTKKNRLKFIGKTLIIVGILRIPIEYIGRWIGSFTYRIFIDLTDNDMYRLLAVSGVLILAGFILYEKGDNASEKKSA